MVDKLAIAKRAQAAGVTVTRVQTVAQWYTTYLDKVAAPKVRASTLANYEYEYRLHIALAIGRLRLDRLEPAHLASLYEAKLASGLSPTSVRLLHANIRHALNVAVKWGLLVRNVALLVDPLLGSTTR